MFLSKINKTPLWGSFTLHGEATCYPAYFYSCSRMVADIANNDLKTVWCSEVSLEPAQDNCLIF